MSGCYVNLVLIAERRVTTRFLRRPRSVCFIGDEIVDSKTLVL